MSSKTPRAFLYTSEFSASISYDTDRGDHRFTGTCTQGDGTLVVVPFVTIGVGSPSWAPLAWHDETFGGSCDHVANEDNYSNFQWDITEASEDRITGSVSFDVQGGGPRSGHSMRIEMWVDVPLDHV
ncbi:MAG: hypothetical protein ACOC9J_01525 [Persicimonas sp.]